MSADDCLGTSFTFHLQPLNQLVRQLLHSKLAPKRHANCSRGNPKRVSPPRLVPFVERPLQSSNLTKVYIKVLDSKGGSNILR